MARQSKKYSGCLWGQKVGVDGVATGTIFKFGNCYPLTLNFGVTQADQISAMCDTAGQTLESRTELESVSGEMTLYQYGAAEIGYAVGATPVAMTGTGATVAAAAVTAPAAGVWREVGHKKLTSLALTNAGATVTYVAGVDYLVNMHLGLWTIVAGGGIAAAAEVMEGYTYAAESGFMLEVASSLQNYLRIFGSLKELSTGNLMAVNLKCVSISSKGGFTLISEPKTEYESLGFDLKLITPAGHTSPATVEGLTED